MPFYSNLLGSAGVNQPAVTPYEISRSLRFNSADSAYLSRTPASTGNRKTWTWAGWVKRTNLGGGLYQVFIARSSDATRTGFGIYQDKLYVFFNDTANWRGQGVAVLRDTAAWYHVVMAVDTTQATESNRIKLWVDNQLQTISTVSGALPSQNTDGGVNNTIAHAIGVDGNNTAYPLDGYLADVHFIDGQALDPTRFGKFDSNDIWQPIEYTGTYGTNGFHLDFADNSTAAALGTDISGNSNTWTVNNISASPYVNYALYLVTPSNPTNPFTASYLSTYVNSSGTILNTTWIGAFIAGSGTVTWTPPTDVTIASTLDVYGGSYDNSFQSYTITITYTDATTDIFNSTTGYNNWVARFSASPVSKTIQKIEVSSVSYPQLCAVRVDGQFLVSNLDTPDSLVDVPIDGTETDTGVGGEVRGNYCTWNPLWKMYSGTFTTTNGNLEAINNINSLGYIPGTFYVSSGKWYWEVFATGTVSSTWDFVGLVSTNSNNSYPGNANDAYWYRPNGNKVSDTGYTGTSYGASWVAGNIIGVALDMDAGNLTFYKNGTSQGVAFSGLSNEFGWSPAVGDYSNPVTSTSWVGNFGQRPFAYTAPNGFKALCTANLPNPAITRPSRYMDVKLYTGNGSTQTISGLKFSPDLVWIKNRAQTDNHKLLDTVRGATEELESNTANAEVTNADGLTAFNSDGFELGDDTEYNTSTEAYVAWTWDAGSSTVPNNDGSITSTVRANASAGFSIVSYTGNGVGGATVGHGLGVAPEMIIIKNRDQIDAWQVYHAANTANPETDYLVLNTTGATADALDRWNDTAPGASVFTLGDGVEVNRNTENYVAYCFTGVSGYSSFGSYTGNGNADGPFVFTNMRPRWILIKRTDTISNWTIIDTARRGYNVDNDPLFPNLFNAEGTTDFADILSNGFKLRTTDASVNANTGTYIYFAIAEVAFNYSRAR